MGALLGGLGGLIGPLLNILLPSIKDIAPIIVGNQAARDTSAASENAAASEAYGKEFSYGAVNRNWWDSLIDGLNRLPRPAFALGCIWMFAYAFISPSNFATTMRSLQLVPDSIYTLTAIIVSFFFVSRGLDKVDFRKFSRSGSIVQGATAAPARFVEAPVDERVLGLAAKPDDEMMRLAGLVDGEYPAAWPQWRNPISLQYAVERV